MAGPEEQVFSESCNDIPSETVKNSDSLNPFFYERFVIEY